jgi:endoribonuclease LACTB2
VVAQESLWSPLPTLPRGNHIQQVAINLVNVGYDSTNYLVLVPEQGTSLLIDCGWPGTLGKLKGQMERKGLRLHDIGLLLITHSDPDHAGLTQELRNEGLNLVLMETQKDHVGRMARYMKPGMPFVPVVVDGAEVLRFSDSRDFLLKNGIAGRIIATPGHSPDSISLVLDDGKAFIGDLPHPLLLSQEDKISQGSWNKIRELGVELVYPAHGPVWNLKTERNLG